MLLLHEIGFLHGDVRKQLVVFIREQLSHNFLFFGLMFSELMSVRLGVVP